MESTETNINSNILDRIKKLLVLGTSSNPNEAENAMAAAQSLMQKHRISVAEIEMQTGVKQESVSIDKAPVFSAGRIPGWKFTLLHTIAKHCGCATYKDRVYKGETSLYLVGRPSDVDMCKYLYSYAISELTRLSDRYCKGKQHRYYDSWYNGAVYGIHMKLKMTNEEINKASMSTAIVLVTNRHQESDEFMRETLNIKKATKSNSKLNGEAFQVGRFVGENRVDLSTKNKLGSGGNKLLP